MFPYDAGNLIRCDCGHAASQHSDAGCAAGPKPCRCAKSPTTIVLEEIALLRPEWLTAHRKVSELGGETRAIAESDVGRAPVLRKVV